MPITCPDPAILFRWRDMMAQAGVGMLIAVAMFAVVARFTRPSGWRLRLAAVLSAALTLGAAVASFVLFTRLRDTPAQVARWLPGYPDKCAPPRSGPPQFFARLQASVQQAVPPLERAAAIDLAVALVALLAIWAAALACIRAAGRRDMAPGALDS